MGTNNEPVGTAAANDKIFSRLELLQETSDAVLQFAQPFRGNTGNFSDVFIGNLLCLLQIFPASPFLISCLNICWGHLMGNSQGHSGL